MLPCFTSDLNLLGSSEYSQILQDFPETQTLAQIIQAGRSLHPRGFFRSCVVASKAIPEDGKERDQWEKLIPGWPKFGSLISWMGWVQLWRGSRGGEGKFG